MASAGIERQAIEQPAPFENFVSAASDGIVIVDSQRRIVIFNGAMQTITGWPSEEAIGEDCDEVIRDPAPLPGGGSLGAFPFREVLETRRSLPYRETVLLHRDSRKIDVGVSCSFVPSPRDEQPFAAAIARDISAIKDAGGVKSDFVSLVSHELRTPLALIKGYIATLLKPEVRLDAGTELRFREGINEAADRLALIVNNFLSASRIESGLFRPHLKETDIRPDVERVVAELRESAHGQLELRWTGKNFKIRADGGQLALVLNNLVGNAIKYAGDDESLPIRITVGGREKDILITVRDRGMGIPRELGERIFEKFYRGPESVGAPGSGLGLYICQKIVEAHGGSIALSQDSDVGTEISFTLPRRAERQSDGGGLSGS